MKLETSLKASEQAVPAKRAAVPVEQPQICNEDARHKAHLRRQPAKHVQLDGWLTSELFIRDAERAYGVAKKEMDSLRPL